MRREHWFFRVSGIGQAVAYDVRFRVPVSERWVRSWLRGWLGGVKRLPAGTEVWPAS
jgi:hypothetical protein